MRRINWTAVLVFGSVVLLVPLIGIGLLLVLFGAQGGMGMIGRGGMMGSWSPWFGGTERFGSSCVGVLLSLIFTPLGLLIPLGLTGLLIAGGVWLVHIIAGASAVVSPSRVCSSCGQPVQADWRNCAHCGEALEKKD